MPRKVRSLRCPTCRRIVLRDEPEFPFCSGRCRLIDLGKWASGAYVITSPVHEAGSIDDADFTGSDVSLGRQSRLAPRMTNRPDGKDDQH